MPLNANERKIKKAYYQLSLLWHPDRWASYPLYQRLAQDVFELVSEAYRLLTDPPVPKEPVVTGGDDSKGAYM